MKTGPSVKTLVKPPCFCFFKHIQALLFINFFWTIGKHPVSAGPVRGLFVLIVDDAEL